jgi:hypothetical protein
MTEDKDNAAYHASAWMADLIRDVEEADKLEGDLKRSIASTLELFRTQGVGGNPDKWHTELYDYYTDLHGHEPEVR